MTDKEMFLKSRGLDKQGAKSKRTTEEFLAEQTKCVELWDSITEQEAVKKALCPVYDESKDYTEEEIDKLYSLDQERAIDKKIAGQHILKRANIVLTIKPSEFIKQLVIGVIVEKPDYIKIASIRTAANNAGFKLETRTQDGKFYLRRLS